ncbi:MAG: hypothetical protein ABL889_19845, partial [Terricaulis sp.]
MTKGKTTGRRKRNALNVFLFLSTALTGSFATNALAQDDESVGVGDIVITATKREENLQDVPISVQALDAERLDELNIT